MKLIWDTVECVDGKLVWDEASLRTIQDELKEKESENE